jgi:hypothetical protein
MHFALMAQSLLYRFTLNVQSLTDENIFDLDSIGSIPYFWDNLEG